MTEYDPNKQYKWEETDEFVMDGNQFGLMLNAFRNYLAKPEAQETMLIMKAETEMTNLLKEGVAAGVVKEMVEPDAEAKAPTQKPAAKPKVRKPQLVKK
jgi:hypothetical protein